MKTFASVIILTVSFLSAGAFAGNELPAQIRHNTVNVTVVYKNQVLPLRGQMTTEACKINRCREA